MIKGSRRMLSIGLVLGLALMPLTAFAEGTQPTTTGTTATVQTTTSAGAITELGVLRGDGQGVTDAYLSKTTTRLQAAILQLRLIGKEQEAQSYTGMESFADSDKAGKANRPILAYLKSHPEYGWNGTVTGGFDPNAPITSQQLYKVMLESLRYHSGSDFAYKDTLQFAATQGLSRAAAVTPFTNRDLAVALTETLQAMPKEATHTLLHELVEQKAVSADKAMLLEGQRIDIQKAADGTTYLTDGKGMALYLFTKDMADLSTCQGACLTNWPVFYSDRLLLPDNLDDKEFGVSIRSDGAKQLTYEGWPLYYFLKDTKAGDINGEGANNVWFLIKQPFYTVGLGTDAKLGNYLVDSKGVTLYYFDKDPTGSSVCTGDCLVKWPAFYADSIVIPKGLKAEDFGEIKRSDGSEQTTFKGYPLYYFFQDAKRGDLKGQSLGDVWFVVNPTTFTGTTVGKAAPPVPAPTKVIIEMKDYSFTPTELTVKAGTTIEFINRDDMKHNAVAVDGSFKIDLLDKGQSATIKLDKLGTYEYYCEPHKNFMKGKIIVQ
ncbi:plastocyanin/azurin family copper-binding protein [Cohnella silvisoli]|uniref:Plastocyanin/azurin family copper-binding protein n=1 Tax=Cohnella silvisoli TaxID=2873699 RepID=A0ABV1KQG9_9BACL|nr:plastocyanin/azurin family copper-binding protein [Cohnella silvisoli]MCD9020969.1 cupredoxin domain-containing protein [Cohnella silvisoli]